MQLTWRHALAVAAPVFLLGYGALRWWSGHGHSLPQNSWVAVGVLAVMAALVMHAGNEIRVYLSGESTRPPSPQRARATVVGAQACVLAGSVFVGWYTATAAVFAGRLQTTTGPSSLVVSVVLAVASAALVACGLVVQAWCTLPEDDDERRRKGRRGPPGQAA